MDADGLALDGLALDGLGREEALDGLALDGLALDGIGREEALDGLALDGLGDDPRSLACLGAGGGIAHVRPVNPPMHAQVTVLLSTLHVAPFRQSPHST